MSTYSYIVGAGVGIRDGLLRIFNDKNEETKALAYQLELLRSGLYNPNQYG